MDPRRRYFRRDGTLIGDVYNMQTPAVFDPGGVRYVDLEIDVAYRPQEVEVAQVIDEDELEEAEKAGNLPLSAGELARKLAAEVKRRLLESGAEAQWNVGPDDVGVDSAPVLAAISARWMMFARLRR